MAKQTTPAMPPLRKSEERKYNQKHRDAEIMAHWQTLIENKDERAMRFLNSPFMKQLIKVLDKYLSKT